MNFGSFVDIGDCVAFHLETGWVDSSSQAAWEAALRRPVHRGGDAGHIDEKRERISLGYYLCLSSQYLGLRRWGAKARITKQSFSME